MLAAIATVVLIVGYFERNSDDAVPTADDNVPSAEESPLGPTYEVDGGTPFENVDAQVRATPGASRWLSHIKYVGPAGPSLFDVFQLQVDTDLSEDSANDTALAIEICKAFEVASAPDTGVVVNGLEFPSTEVQVDGSVVQPPPYDSKLVDNVFGEAPYGICQRT